jgi:uncharacterized cupin superfamily protein
MRLRQLGKPAGSIALGATLTEVAPGGISFPRHAHYVNEEAIYVLSGAGEARIGDARVPVRPGDWIALPTGPEHAHQMVNVSAAEPLVYLCISTMRGGGDRRVSRFRQSRRRRRRSDKSGRLPPHWHVSSWQRHARLLGERARGGLSSVQPGTRASPHSCSCQQDLSPDGGSFLSHGRRSRAEEIVTTPRRDNCPSSSPRNSA